MKERTKSTEEYPKAKKSETPAKQQSGKWITATPQVPKSLEKTPKNTGKTQKIVENESKDLEKMSKAVEKMPKVVEKVGSSTKQEKSSSKKCSSSKGVAEHTDGEFSNGSGTQTCALELTCQACQVIRLTSAT